MENSEGKVEPVETTKVPVAELTAEYLVRTRGLDMKTAQAIVRYANLFTGSNRKIDDEFWKMFRDQEEHLRRQGISIKHEITEMDPITKTPIRTFYSADWQRLNTPPPRGERGTFPKDLQNPPILDKNFIIIKKL